MLSSYIKEEYCNDCVFLFNIAKTEIPYELITQKRIEIMKFYLYYLNNLLKINRRKKSSIAHLITQK